METVFFSELPVISCHKNPLTLTDYRLIEVNIERPGITAVSPESALTCINQFSLISILILFNQIIFAFHHFYIIFKACQNNEMNCIYPLYKGFRPISILHLTF